MSKNGSSLVSFLSLVAIVVGILSLFLPMYWDLGNRVSRLEGAFSVAEPLMGKATITQTVIVQTVTLTTTSGLAPPFFYLSPEALSTLGSILAIVAGLLASLATFWIQRRKSPTD